MGWKQFILESPPLIIWYIKCIKNVTVVRIYLQGSFLSSYFSAICMSTKSILNLMQSLYNIIRLGIYRKKYFGFNYILALDKGILKLMLKRLWYQYMRGFHRPRKHYHLHSFYQVSIVVNFCYHIAIFQNIPLQYQQY